MKTAIHDKSLLSSIGPTELTSYLKASGWTLQADVEARGSVWIKDSLGEGEEADILVPATRAFKDYALRIAELMHTLAQTENRSELHIFRDIKTSTSDLLRLRASSRDTDDGTLPLEEAVRFIEKSRDMMLAAACSAVAKRAVYARRKPDLAMNYLRHARMGQTEQGSFILTILSPVAPELKAVQGSFLPSEPAPPYERQVTLVLMDALGRLHAAAKAAALKSDMAPFREGVPSGISANLCDAVVGLSSISSGAPLDIKMTWASSRPSHRVVPDRVIFDRDLIPVIEEAARQFRETEPLEDLELVGVVTRLDRGPTASEGEVIVSGPVEGQMLGVVIALDPNAYSLAIQAHQKRLPVICTGDLLKEGRSYRLTSPRHFRILNVEQDSFVERE
jgi:hypothetical protein